MRAQWEREKEQAEGHGKLRERLDEARRSSSAPSASSTTSAPPSCATARSPTSSSQARRGRPARGRTSEPAVYLSRARRRRRDRRGRRQVDRHPGLAPDGGRGGEAASTWRSACTSGSSARTRRSRPVSNALRRSRAGLQRPRPPDRHVPVPRPDRRRQDRAGPRAGRVHVRLAGRDGPHRHVRVHGEALRGPARRRASRLRRLRGGRPAHRGGAPAPVLASSCSTRSRRPTPTSSTSCCR